MIFLLKGALIYFLFTFLVAGDWTQGLGTLDKHLIPKLQPQPNLDICNYK